MTNIEIIEYLKKEIETNDVSKAVSLVFSQRKRPRQTLTIAGLDHRMQEEGFNYPPEKYIPFLEALAHVGFGTLVYGPHTGALVGLKNVNKTFKSIGDVLWGKAQEFVDFKPRRFMRAVPTVGPKPVMLAPKPGLRVSSSTRFDITLEVEINGKPLKLRLPKEFTGEDISLLVTKFRGA